MSDENKTAAWQAHAAERERGEPRLAKCGHVAYRDHATLCIQDGCPNAAYVQHPARLASPPVPSEPKCYSEGTRVYTADDKLLVDTYCGARKFKESQDLAKWIAANFPAAPHAPAAEPLTCSLPGEDGSDRWKPGVSEPAESDEHTYQHFVVACVDLGGCTHHESGEKMTPREMVECVLRRNTTGRTL